MEKLNDGGPAFPRPISMLTCEEVALDHEGMTLRDWFAGQALAGLYADPNVEWNAEDCVKAAYRTADSMLAERSRTGTEASPRTEET